MTNELQTADERTTSLVQAMAPPTALSSAQRRGVARRLARQRLREYLTFDSFVARRLLALGGLLGGWVLRACGQPHRGLSLWATIHRGDCSDGASRLIERWLRSSAAAGPGGAAFRAFEEHIARLAGGRDERFCLNPQRMLGTRALVLKSPGANEKGVLLLDYSFVFPLFAKMFDIRAVAERYHLVLEPSWSGYCDLDVLCYAAYDFPVFVQAYEPRDADFLRRVGRNLIPVATSANWWVDHRVFRPLPGVQRDADLVMVASWAPFKRHDRVLAALARLRARGRRLKAILVGYPNQQTREDIHRLACYYGVEDQVELHEHLSAEQVNEQLNRARVNVIWSRREGVNRAIIEGMFAGVPCIVREGFNYGHRYAYVNDQTGYFVGERAFPDRLLSMVDHVERFSPRPWVLERMTCQRGTAIIEEAIRQKALEMGETWTRGLAVKVSHLSTMRYWDEGERPHFEADYAFLRSMVR